MVDALFADGFRSMIRLPFKPAVDLAEVERHLKGNLTPRLLLLLDAVEELQVRTPEWSMSAAVARQRRGDHDEVLLESDYGDEHWLVFRRNVPILDPGLVAALEGAWKEVTKVGVAIGVPLGEGDRPVRSEAQPLHVYFPTEETTGSALLLHGDFVLELDRRHIAGSPEAEPFNRWLVGELAALTGDVAERLARLYPGDGRVINALAPVGPASGFGEELRRATIEALSARSFVPLLDGRIASPVETAVLPDAIRSHENAYALLETATLPKLVAPSVERIRGRMRLSRRATRSRGAVRRGGGGGARNP